MKKADENNINSGKELLKEKKNTLRNLDKLLKVEINALIKRPIQTAQKDHKIIKIFSFDLLAKY